MSSVKNCIGFIFQIISSIGIPVNLELEGVTIGIALKTHFYLPTNDTDFLAELSAPFDVKPIPIERRSVDDEQEFASSGFDSKQHEQFERHTVEAKIVESGPEPDENVKSTKSPNSNLATIRWLIYKGLAEAAEK